MLNSKAATKNGGQALTDSETNAAELTPGNYWISVNCIQQTNAGLAKHGLAR